MAETPQDQRVIEVPGVGNVAFPSSMSDEEVSAAINRYYQEGTFQQEPQTTVGGMVGSATRGAGPYGAAALGGGVLGGPGGAVTGVAAMGLSQFVGNPLVMGVNKAFDTNFATPTEALNKFFDSIGVERPDTATEQFISILGEGMASGPTQAGRSVTRQVLQGAAQAVAGEGAREVAEAAGAGRGGQLAASLLAGVGTGVMTAPRGAVRPRPGQMLDIGQTAVLAKQAAKGNEAAKMTLASQAANGIDEGTMVAAKELGVSEYMTPGMITTNKHFKEFENALAQFPDSILRDRRARVAYETAQNADELLKKISKRADSGDLSQLDVDIKDRRLLDVKNLDAKADKLYDALRETVPSKGRVQPTEILTYLENRIEELGGGDRRKGLNALSSLERNAYKNLKPTPRLQGGQVYEELPTYAMLDNIRRDIGDAAREKGAFKDTPSGIASHMYSLLTRDQEAAVDALGGSIPMWESAKAAVKQSKAIQDSLTAVYGKQLDKGLAPFLESATKSMAKGDISKWNKLMELTPKDMRPRVASGALSHVLYQKAATGNMQLDDFVRWYEAVDRNKLARRALFEPLDGNSRLGLQNIYKVSKAIQDVGDKTNRAYVAGAIGGTQSLMHKLYSTAFKVSGIQLFSDLMERANMSRAGAYRLGMEIPNAVMVTGQNKSINQVNRLIGSPEFMDLVRAMADGRPLEKYINGLTKSQMFMTFARQSNLSTKQEDMDAYVRTGLFGLPPKSEQ